MKVEISPTTELKLREIAAKVGMPATEGEKFEARPAEMDNSYMITVYPHQLMEAVRRAYALGVEQTF